MQFLHNLKQKHIIEKISKTSFLFGVGVIVVGLLAFNFSFFKNAQARLDDIVVDTISQPINIDRSEPFYIYFSYGSKDNKIPLNNIQFQIDIVGSGFDLVPTGFADIYSSNSQNTITCSNIPLQSIHPIDQSLFSGNKLLYSPQTATNTLSPSGNGSPQTLAAGQHGCIRAELKVQNGAIAGLQSNIIFEPDFANSNSYNEQTKPSRQVFKLATGPALGAPTSLESMTASRPTQNTEIKTPLDTSISVEPKTTPIDKQTVATNFFIPENSSNQSEVLDDTPNVQLILMVGAALVIFSWVLWIYKIYSSRKPEFI